MASSVAGAEVPQTMVVQESSSEQDSVQALLKLQSILKVKTELAGMRSRPGAIERRRRVSPQEFLDAYYSANQPVILFDLFTGSRAMTLWTPQYLCDLYGDEIVEVMMDRQSDPLYEMNSSSHKRAIPFSDYIQRVLSGGESNDYYLVANNHLFDRPAFRSLYDDFGWPPYLDESTRDNRVFFWLGPAGTVTPLHHDECNILLVQVRGRKFIQLISPDFTPCLYNRVGVFSDVDVDNPDLERHPLFREVKVHKTILHPGEALFIPVAWWHQVRSCDVCISLSFTNFRFANSFNFFAPRIL